MLQLKFVLKFVGDRRTLPCALRELRSLRCSVTRWNCGATRPSPAAIAPVSGTMLLGSTYTGRPASLSSAKRCTPAKLRSTKLDCRVLSEYVASKLALTWFQSTGPDQLRFDRRLLGAA